MRFEQNMRQQQKQVQKLAMTQQLQQSIQMLQFNAEELRTFLEAKSLENPLIEVKIETDYVDAPIRTTSNYSSGDSNEHNYINQIPDESISLFEYLLEQIHLNYRDTLLRQLVLYLTEYIDVNGYLKIDLAEAAKQTKGTEIQMLDALTLVQQLDPAGVGARDIRECLMLQTERDDEAPNLAYLVLEEDFENFVERKWQAIALKYKVPVKEIQEISDYIQTLTPYPGAAFGYESEQFILPDLIIEIEKEKLKVLSTKSGAPVVQFQQKYFDQMQKVADKEVQSYMKEKKAEFDWIQRSVLQRGDTILKVGGEIVKRQKSFFLDSDRPLKPMTLKEIAEVLEVHESTISRSVNGKYLQTSFGVYELRSFFTTGLAMNNNEEDISSNAVKQRIQEVVDQENKAKPLSDQKIVEILQGEEIEVSRRTVAKYRDALKIPSSTRRKRYDE